MLGYASLNEAWVPDVKKKKKPSIQVQENNNPKNDYMLTKFEDTIETLVVRISDPAILDMLNIYKDEYKVNLITNIVRAHLLKENIVQQEPETANEEPKRVETFVDPDDENLKDVISFLGLGIIILVVMELIKISFRKLYP